MLAHLGLMIVIITGTLHWARRIIFNQQFGMLGLLSDTVIVEFVVVLLH
jgi:hypothetical protein